MKKILFISNITNKITNFSLPSIIESKKLGYEFHLAANLENFKDDSSKYEIKTHHIDFHRNPLNIKNLKAMQQILKLLDNENFDVIHCNTPIGGLIGRLSGSLKKVPKIIYSAHGFHFYEGGNAIKNFIYFSIEKVLARHSDAIITMNDEDFKAAKNFKLRNNGEVFYVPGVGVDIEKYNIVLGHKSAKKMELGINEDDIVLISMGDLIARKNYEASIKAIAKANNPNLKYLICGTGPKLNELETLSSKLGIQNQVIFLGFRDDIKELLSIADIFLFTTNQEGLPRSLMEAMASGLPVIVSKVRGNVDLVDEMKGGLLINQNNVDDISNAINQLISNEGVRLDMGKYNLSKVQNFSVQNVMKKIEYIYSKEL